MSQRYLNFFFNKKSYLKLNSLSNFSEKQPVNKSQKHCENKLEGLMNEPANNLKQVCKFVNKYFPYQVPKAQAITYEAIQLSTYMTNSPKIKDLLRCFTQYFNKPDIPTDFINSLLDLNYTLLLDEMESCTNNAILIPESDIKREMSTSDILQSLLSVSNSSKKIYASKLYTNLTSKQIWEDVISNSIEADLNEIEEISNKTMLYFRRMESIKELTHLTGNPNYLHRPVVDNDFIEEYPHVTLRQPDNYLNKIEVMAGITDHEAFYFLENNYDFNEIIRHAFTFSSLLNRTERLIEKLVVINENLEVNICLKKKMLEFYKVSPIELSDLMANKLVKNLQTLDLMCDYEFNLAFIAQLKLKMSHQQNNPNISKMFVYRFSFNPSINIMLKTYLPFSDIYNVRNFF